jgi:hypothetical protein
MRALPCLAIPLAVGACAARASAPTAPVAALEPSEVTPDRPEPAHESAADYRALVRAAAAREGTDDASCLFARDAGGLRMLGYSNAALRPLPSPEVELDAALAQSVSVNVLTPFGRYGGALGALTLASFTYAPPTREAVALVITDQGIALRGTTASVPMRDKLPVAQAVQAVTALMPATVFVAAEAQVSTLALADLLGALQAQRVPVALAVNLAPATRLPEPPPAPSADICPSGLPDTNEAEGALDVSALAPALSDLRTHAAECLNSAEPRGMAGGHLSLLLRVSESGALADACIDRDETGDGRLRACILAQAKKLRFPQPAPRGSVDLALPLALVPAHPPASALLCTEP